MTQNKGDEVDTDFKSKFLNDAEIAHLKLAVDTPSLCLDKRKQVRMH